MNDLELLRKVGGVKETPKKRVMALDDELFEQMYAPFTYLQKKVDDFNTILSDVESHKKELAEMKKNSEAALKEQESRIMESISNVVCDLQDTKGGNTTSLASLEDSISVLNAILDDFKGSVYQREQIDALLKGLESKLPDLTPVHNSIESLRATFSGVNSQHAEKIDALAAAHESHVKELSSFTKKFKTSLAGIKKIKKVVAEMGYSLQLFVDGTSVGATPALNIKAGTNITATSSYVNGIPTVTLNSTGSSSFTVLTATGTVDGVNKTFTFTSKPTYIISDGVWYRENHGWTYSGSTATMDVPPTNDIYGAA